MAEKVRVFIGSGEASCLERKTLIHSLRKHTQRELDIYVFNGTHNAVERNDEPPFDAGLPLHIKYKNYTEFSNYRFLIPRLCGYQGRAIWLDSDMVCLHDIGTLFDADLRGCDFLAKSESYENKGQGYWALSVMLIDCAKARFDLDRYFAEMQQGIYGNLDLHAMTPTFLQHHRFQIGEIDRQWNVFDQYDQDTKLIHYTNLLTQPWKFPGHPYGDLWHRCFQEALQAGSVSSRDVELALGRAYARQDVLLGDTPQPAVVAAPTKQRTVLKLRNRLNKWWGKISRPRAA